eukprot:CAMPEP_0196600730 /NCGR_PEP_ID=MMETSP1081-20130531/95542_1 /TAXON_ID=36882 /ORGANISM="Pyramimonas amylifera, Strain CCMP720" /LENGTH=397 /DNA_ID=CAMNT_0041926583 /DNA_START=569 /DNA_END=1762 /DNA_ORIENTATION=+
MKTNSDPKEGLGRYAWQRWGVKSESSLGQSVNGYNLDDGVYQDFPQAFVKREVLRSARIYREQTLEVSPTVLGFVDSVVIASRRYMGRIDYGYMIFPVGKQKLRPKKAPPQVFLSTLLTAEGFSVVLIDQFLGHYSNLGISRNNMLVTINVNERVNKAGLEKVIQAVSRHSAYYDLFVGNWSSEALTFHQAHKLISSVRSEDWIVTVDSDEFHDLQHYGSYPEFLSKCDDVGINFVRGTFVDRLAESGELVRMNARESVQSQFPLACSLSKVLPTGSTKKIMAYKGGLRINRGHHRLALCDFYDVRGYTDVSPYGPCSLSTEVQLVPYPSVLGVHHFKWMKGVEEATRYKATRYSNMSGRSKETGEAYTRLVEHLEDNDMRFNVSDARFGCKLVQPN